MTIETVAMIFTTIIIPILGILSKFLIDFLKVKSQEIKSKTENEVAKNYIDMITNTITDCVIATNQTYVEALKKQGKFDEAAQKEAFKQTLNAVLAVLTEDAKAYIYEISGDVTAYLTSKIESSVNQNKK
jgi:hypothetical protein